MDPSITTATPGSSRTGSQTAILPGNDAPGLRDAHLPLPVTAGPPGRVVEGPNDLNYYERIRIQQAGESIGLQKKSVIVGFGTGVLAAASLGVGVYNAMHKA